MQQMQNNSSGLSDREMCEDMLMTEKFVSNAYNISVLEAANQDVRSTMEKIQNEEHGHAESVFQYMQKKGWYNPQ